MPSVDIAALLDDEEENLKLRQINVMHVSIMDLLSDPGNPLYAEPHSMAKHYDAMFAGARALGDLPEHTHCRDSSATARVHEDEAQQVCQKILRCLDMRVMDGNLIVPTCLRTPTLILSARCFVQLYYDPDAQGQYASDFPTRGQGFLQPRGDIRTSIIPRNFRILPNDVREVVDLYFHREGLDVQENQESNDCTSTDMEAANTVRRLQLHCSVATASLQMAVHEALVPATATRPQEEEYQYNSDNSVLDLDEEYPGLAEWVMQWWAAHQGTACAPPWWPSDFGRPEQSHFNKLPNLRELLNQAEEAKACQRVPGQSVALTPLPFTSIRDLDRQRQQRHDQTIAKHQSSLLGGEQWKRAKTPPQPDPYDAPDVQRIREEQNQGRDRGHLRTRVDHQSELDRARSKSQKRSKSRRRSKSWKRSKSRRSKSSKCDGGRERDRHKPRRPGVWSSQQEREMPGQSPSRTTQKDMRDAGHSAFSNDLSKFWKLKDEVVKNAQSYIRRRATVIFCTLSPDHEAVKCLSAFGDQAQKFAAEVLAIIEWGTQHWKLQETFPVPVIPRWLRTPEFTQTTNPLRGELLLMPTGCHIKDIRALSGDVVLDGCPPPILAGSHDSLSIRGPIPLHQRLGSHRHPGHQPMASAPGVFRLGVHGHERHIVD